ncbi:Uncharacterized membrane-anchored protein YjiN, DUF445 family [Chishuiella changwenlii]|uniref:Membrane protein n=1 Tax=Chishuiella changwenlii TaxID=1434701 RepID=A0A1M7D295_9FLAO|nr:DUF445 domain-containing protein [Chishuiella changwenlii]GGF10742.1 membrane protein [Chishuiella changwenlii]SHL73641.1 Uncharacterized membrane-anchored protein YjiN, DUF445 family [Chishuiella changwenlii]
MTEQQKIQNLKKHKAIATGLFFVMALVYFLMVYLSTQFSVSWIGYVEAFAEAAMVGALADWFAVTALFRYPLGLKIPHTNLIENSKNAIGDNLGQFVTGNFLTPATIRPYIEKLEVVKYVSDWLNKTSNQEMLQQELINFAKKVIKDLDDKDVVDFMTLKGEEILKQFNLQELASSSLEYILEKQKHDDILEAIIPKAKEYIAQSDIIIKDKINEKHPVISFFAGRKISKGVVEGVISLLDEIENDKEHPIRLNIEKLIQDNIENIKQSPDWKLKLEALRDDFITQERLEEYASDLWLTLKQSLTDSFDNQQSVLQNYIQKNIDKLAYNLSHNQEMIFKINGWVRHFLYRMILRNVKEVESLISNTVDKWEGKQLSEKLELEVGKDLQFIRINGTLVGGLVGLIIYAVTQLIFH